MLKHSKTILNRKVDGKMKNSRKSSTGHTLLEVLIISAIFLATVCIASSILIDGWKAFLRGDLRADAIQKARNTLYRICKDIRNSENILSPGKDILKAEAGADSIVYSRINYSGDVPVREIFGYSIDAPSGTVLLIKYDSSYDPEKKETQKVLSSKIIMKDVTGLSFNLNPDPEKDDLLKIRLSSKNKEGTPVNLESQVQRRG
ncbi:MAG: hypothetical protein M1536_05995 [Firmicutes bacterium]|nr:hypothetical protein [Bacillota bacterium]